jgi:low affinity Fe/Cu permease
MLGMQNTSSRRPVSHFASFAKWISHATGRPATFIGAVIVIIGWSVSGPIFHYSDTWQLVINTGTTIITFLMVFLIQNTQNRDGQAIQMKLDELICVIGTAQNAMLDLEECDEAELEKLHTHYTQLAEKARKTMKSGRTAGKKTAKKRGPRVLGVARPPA